MLIKTIRKVAAKERLANYKIPRRFVRVDSLPRNASGKILKRQLKEMSLAADGDQTKNTDDAQASSQLSRSQTHDAALRSKIQETYESQRLPVAIEFLQSEIQNLLSSDERPSPETRLVDAGLDSLMLVDLSARLQHELGDEFTISPTLVFDYPRISDLAEFLVSVLVVDERSVEEDERQEIEDEPVDCLRNEVESMSEDDALAALMKELED